MKVKVHCVRPYKHPFPLVSWLIMWAQGTNYSHMVLETESGICYDMYVTGFRTMTKAEFEKKYTKVYSYEISLNDFAGHTIYEFVSHFANAKYSWSQIFGLLFMEFGFISHNPYGEDANKLVCNEFIILMLNYFGLLDMKDSDDYDLNATRIILGEVGTQC
jgi:hypothetical protein